MLGFAARRFLLAIPTIVVLALMFFTASRGEAAARIELVAVPTRIVQSSPPPGRTGNLESLHWSLRDRFGRTVGEAYFTCRWHRRHTRLCVGEISMPLGTIIAAGSSTTRSLGLFAVTGGTGRYAAAGGELRWIATGIRKLTITIAI